ncbi:efflux RND transporter periplasmic adaptor subunit [Neisseriaceae bacterium B1]
MNQSVKPWRLAALALATSLALTACGDKAAQEQQQKAAAARAAHVPEVGVVTVQPQDVLLANNLPGRLEAIRSATIVPQVNGIVKRRLFQEGSFVKAGQPLYQLEDDSYGAALANARASLAQAQAQAAKANSDLARYRPLVQADAISKQEYDAAVAAKRAADAAVAAANAAIRSAQVNMNHARITAPISGFIGESKVTEGALVMAGTTQMALIQQNDPMYVNITMSAGEMMKLRQQLANKERLLNDNIEVGILLEDGTEYAHKGRLLFVNPTVDEATGQITVRVEVPNPELVLMSGLYVRVNLPLAGVTNAFVVPQQAVSRGNKDIVMVVTPSGEMQPRPVKITGQKGSDWVITEGLQAGDKVIVDGIMIAGMSGAKTVKPVEWKGKAAQNTAQQAAPAAAASQAAQPVQAASQTAPNQAASSVQAASAASSAK